MKWFRWLRPYPGDWVVFQDGGYFMARQVVKFDGACHVHDEKGRAVRLDRIWARSSTREGALRMLARRQPYMSQFSEERRDAINRQVAANETERNDQIKRSRSLIANNWRLS